jgi:hypothetical protein
MWIITLLHPIWQSRVKALSAYYTGYGHSKGDFLRFYFKRGTDWRTN